jgi:hypothetical protein
MGEKCMMFYAVDKKLVCMLVTRFGAHDRKHVLPQSHSFSLFTLVLPALLGTRGTRGTHPSDPALLIVCLLLVCLLRGCVVLCCQCIAMLLHLYPYTELYIQIYVKMYIYIYMLKYIYKESECTGANLCV